MQEYIDKYKIEKSFLRRYFMQNAESIYYNKLLDFMFWKRGKLLLPKDKEKNYEEFTKEEIVNFYEKNEINIPQLELMATTKCTLKCKYCVALVPQFDLAGGVHKTLTFKDFKSDFDILCNTVNNIYMFHILGGEALINQELPEIVEYVVESGKTGSTRIVTNGTLLPSKKLLETARKYSDRVYFSISNYARNEELKKIIKQNEIIEVLKDNGIKYQVNPDFMWNVEEPLKYRNYSEEQLKQLFRICHYKQCIELLDGKIHICGKQSMTYELHEKSDIRIPVDDYVDVRNSKNLREDLIKFYQKDYFDVCKYCVRLDKQILPAEQIG
ncbi:MAG: hypothetical protein LBG48_05290 [Rickettsiales bacterium]|jgi:hypothetical protein|nr:hypothetical protein [Rickettsiales bacterium]